tara:strand:- start:10072 stop:11823 length:1752 start_codon:yes stop_codon:yes gene_type:complete
MGKPLSTIFNLGSSHVSASKFSLQEDGLSLDRFKLLDLPPNSGNEQEWLSAIEIAVSELSSQWGFKGEASFILPSSIVLSKTLRVPKVETEKQRKVVEFELSQKMPFPLESLLWDFLVIDDDGIEQEILSFAIKPELIEKLTQSIFGSGVVPLKLTPGPALDFCSLNGRLEADEANSLLINFGARSTNLTFFSSSGFLLRSFSQGGGSLTEAIASSFGVNHTKAEQLKLNYTSASQPKDSTDNATNTLHAVHENFLNKSMQEISRSIVTYKRLKKGKAPSQLIITGRATKSSLLVQNLAQSQTQPIKYFDPFKQIKISEEIEDEDRANLPYIGSEILGLANILLLDHKASVLNLMPKAKLRELENKKKLPWFLCSALIISLIPLPWYLNLSTTEDYLSSEEIKLKRHTLELSNKLKFSQKENSDLVLLKAINQIAAKHVTQLESLSKKAFSLQDLLNNLQLQFDPEINQNAWIDRFEFIPSERIPAGTTASNFMPRSTRKHARISGRYLVKPDEQLNDIAEDERRLALIEESGRIQESLTKAIASIDQVLKVSKKTFSIEGKGDLYNRQFTHFEFELELDLEK